MLNRNELFRLRALPQAALAIAACGASGAIAQTGDPAAGAALYTQNLTVAGAVNNCQNCHGTNGVFRAYFMSRGVNEAGVIGLLNTAIMNNKGGMSAYATWTPTMRSDVAAYIMRGPVPPPPPPFVPPPGTVPATPTATPNTVMFNSTPVGSVSTMVSILFQNSTGATITFANPAIVPATGNTADFRSAAVPPSVPSCAAGGTIGPGSTCSFGAEFVPTAGGDRTATWNVNFTGGVTARMLTLQGTATAAASTGPTTSAANAPLNAGAGALGWINLLGLLSLLGVSRWRRR